MTAATGDALSHVVQQRSPRDIFNKSAAAKIVAVRRQRGGFARSSRRTFVPAADAWAHELFAGTGGFRNHSITRITCSNLGVTDDDLVRQYF
jgi:hypothetical protein